MRVNTRKLPRVEAHEIGRPRYRIRNPIVEGQLYQYRQGFWDYYGVTVATALTRQNLFIAPIGQSYTPAGGAALVKSIWHTNMELAGLLPSPQVFFAKGISISLRSDVNVGDAIAFLDETMVKFNISSRDYMVSVASKLPAQGGTFGFSSGIINNGVPDTKNLYQFSGALGETILQLQSFGVEMDPTRVIDAAAGGVHTTATAALGGTGINCHVTLDGLKNREVL